MKPAIILNMENYPSALIIPVDDYSKDSVINAISKATGIATTNIVQLSASVSYGIYALKSYVSSDLIEMKDYRSVECPFCFEVRYGKIVLK